MDNCTSLGGIKKKENQDSIRTTEICPDHCNWAFAVPWLLGALQLSLVFASELPSPSWGGQQEEPVSAVGDPGI
ncbi:hypothetical protein AB205_0020000 [Aquarana catesbeiana]|uniref:Uncharacterized protein n=1 Tax=Aquarana catesbeiana TaxID=8400 RepID=A0A2G9SLR5_AQUCT|nr:hypothetical protein AB205_0020000 [Aquarana catesbeiana]